MTFLALMCVKKKCNFFKIIILIGGVLWCMHVFNKWKPNNDIQFDNVTPFNNYLVKGFYNFLNIDILMYMYAFHKSENQFCTISGHRYTNF